MLRRIILPVSIIILLIFVSATVIFAIDSKDKEALDLMDFAVKQTIKETGVEAIGVGSWVSQKNYKGPLTGGKSDHDLRVVLTNETNGTVITKKWKDFQGKLKENIVAMGQAKKLSDGEISKMLNATNVYPPNQLVETVENAEDAKKLFTKAGSKPNLGDAPVEGIWGKGSKTYKQYYEEKSGKLFFIDEKSGKVMTGATDLTHLTEGAEVFTTPGEVNKARQWADKVIEQLEEGNIDKAAKQAERLRTSINKARGLERLGGRVDYLDDIVAGTITDPDAIRAAIKRARDESGLLLALAEEGNVKTRSALKSILTSEAGQSSKMGKLFWKYADKVPVAQLFHAFQLYGYYATVKDISAMSGADFNAAVMSTSGKELAWMAGPLAGLGAELADMTLQMAKEGAYSLVTGFQDCEDLATGVHSVKGREELNKGMTIDQMVSAFQDTTDGRKKLQNFVWYQAYQASLRLEGDKWVPDTTIQNKVYQKCFTPLVNRWREKRLEKISAFNVLFREFDKIATNGKAIISIEPSSNPIPLREQTREGKIARVSIFGGLSQNQDRMDELVKKMNILLAALEGSKKDVIFAGFAYQLSLDNRGLEKTYKPTQRTEIFTAPGNHSAALTLDVSISGTYASEDIEKYGLLQGYRKQYNQTATQAFSIAEDTAKIRLRLDCPSAASPSQTYPLTAVIDESMDIPRSSIRIAWGSVTSNERLIQSYADRVTRSEKAPGRYEYIAEAFVQEQGKMIKLADARCTVDVRTDDPEKKKPGILDTLSNIARELQKQPIKPPAPEPPKQEPPKAEPPKTAQPKPEPPKTTSTQPNLAENERLCECVNQYERGPRTDEQRRSYDKWCTDKTRCKGTEMILVEPFKYDQRLMACWGFVECREYSYDPETKQNSTRTCGSFKGAIYMYQAKEQCAQVK
jgi:hypothetical protein